MALTSLQLAEGHFVLAQSLIDHTCLKQREQVLLKDFD